MAGGRKFWRFVGLLPDTHAHQIMAMVAQARGYVEQFVPANTGPEDQEGQPTSATGPRDFIAAYISEHPSFKLKDLVAAGVQEGLSKTSLQAAVYALKGTGTLHHTGTGTFSVGKAAKLNGAAKKSNGAGKHKRAERGTVEAALLSRLNRAHGAPVATAALKEAIIEAGASPKTLSGMLFRLTEAKRIKKAEEKGHYLAV